MTKNIEGGYFFLARKIVDSSIFSKPPLYFKVWIYLLSRAQHSDYRGLKRGQLYTSIPEIIEATSWKVGFRTEKPTKDQIFQVLAWLRKSDEGGNESNARAPMIATTKATHGLLVTICNYNVYQDSSNYESNDEYNNEKVMKPERKQQRSDNINKNVKNDKNDNVVTRKKRVYDDDDPNKKLAVLLFKSISRNQNIKEPDFDKWANTIRLTIEADKRTGKEVQDMIVWATSHDFWSGVILSPASLRKNFDKMIVQKNKQMNSQSVMETENSLKLFEETQRKLKELEGG